MAIVLVSVVEDVHLGFMLVAVEPWKVEMSDGRVVTFRRTVVCENY